MTEPTTPAAPPQVPIEQVPTGALSAEQLAAQAAASAAASAIKPPPASRDEAMKRIGELKANKEWTAKYLGGDAAARKEMFDLVKAAYSQNDDTEIATRLSALQRNGMPDPSTEVGKDLMDIAAGKPISSEVRRAAEAKKAAMLADAGFRQRYLAGDQEARRQLTTVSILLAAQVERKAVA